ncbi:AraC family transcriptional regulator, partial [Methylopila musalis]
MNVSAAVTSDPAPLWRLDGPRTLFIGALDRNAEHEHGAPVFLAGPYGRFALKVADGPWRTCRTALIPAGVRHELRLDGDPLGVLYLEPQAEGAPALQALLRDTEEADGALIGHAGETETFRALFDDPASLGWADEALADLTRFAGRRAPRALDGRAARAA